MEVIDSNMPRFKNETIIYLLIWVIAIAAQFFVQQGICLEVISDPDDDVEVFSSKEIHSINNLTDVRFKL